MNSPYRLLIDTWEGQLNIDENILKINDVAGIIVRLNNMSGGHHKDVNFDAQWSQAAMFHRAVYFVYNPWVNGQANFDWLSANMPVDAKFVFLDIEVVYPGYSSLTYANEVKKFVALVKTKWKYAIYTGEWFLPYLSFWDTTSDYWWAQYYSAFYPSSTQNWTWTDIHTKLAGYTLPANATKIPGKLKLWQFTADRIVLPGNSKPIDVSVFYGSDADLANWFGETVVTPPVPNVVFEPFDLYYTDIDGIRKSQRFIPQ